MPIRPVNFQVMLPKTAEISKLNADELNKSHLLQQQQNASVQNKAENNLKQVYARKGPEEARVKEKQEKGQSSKEKQKKEKKQQENKDLKVHEKTSTIDIRL